MPLSLLPLSKIIGSNSQYGGDMEIAATKTEISTELADLAEEAHTLAEASKAPRTFNAYRSDF